MRWLRALSSGAFLCAIGCAAQTGETESEAAETQSSALTAQPGASSASQSAAPSAAQSAAQIAALSASARLHPTGRREPTAEEVKQHERVKRVVEVKPTQLALDRVQSSSANTNTSAGKAARVAPAVATSVGDDLVSTEGAPGANAARASAPVSALAAATLPASVDNSALPGFPEIRDQGSIGSCVGFALGYYQYTHEVSLLTGWNNKNSNNTTKFSPKMLYNLSNWGNDGGTTDFIVYDILRQNGALTWAEFPYTGDTSNPINYREWPRTAAAWKSALKYRAIDYAYLEVPTTPASIQAVKNVLTNGHVITFSTQIYSWVYAPLSNDPGTSADDAFAGQSGAVSINGWEGGHEATVVGYNDNIWLDLNYNGVVDNGEKGAFKMANSWGPNWGNAGYLWIAYDALYDVTQVNGGFADPNRHGIMGSLSVITARANYQPNLVQELTLSTAERGRLAVQIQLTEPDRTARFASEEFKAFGYGGSVAFDGTVGTQPKPGTFAFDLTDLAASYGDVKYRVQVNNGGHFATTLSGVALVDRLKSNLRTATTDPVATIGENEGKAQSVRYKYQDPSRVPRLTITPASSIAFGSTALASTVERALTLNNTGTGSLYLSSLRFNNPLFRALNYYPQYDTFKVDPGKSLTMTLEFAPAASQAETATLSVLNTSSNLPNPNLALSGTGMSTNDSAPLQVFITQQNDPLDNSIALRAEIKNRTASAVQLSKYRVLYYMYETAVDFGSLRWDTAYTTQGPIGYLVDYLPGRTAGVRWANSAITFTFPANASIAPGGSFIFQGNIHRTDYSWYPDETDDWSRYLRRDGLAEGVVIQNIATKAIVFGVSGELPQN
jgi:C1A family cysteine protease